MGRSTFGRGRVAFSRARLFAPTRRVVVKARIARHTGRAFRAAPLSAHVAYLKREGVTLDGEKARMFDAETDRPDDAAFADRTADDRHHFRFIISPEDAGEMTDLRAFTRDLARQMEADLGTRLDWVAVDHWNTDNPHVHLLVRGVDEAGQDLVISRDYISRGLRARRRSWSRSNSARSRSTKSARPLSAMSAPNNGPGSIPKSAWPPMRRDTWISGQRS
jgi:type IV secretory pathway VirD2 relaxase